MGTSEQFPGWYSRIEGPDGAGKITARTLLSLSKEVRRSRMEAKATVINAEQDPSKTTRKD
jgi:thymidylate kinase